MLSSHESASCNCEQSTTVQRGDVALKQGVTPAVKLPPQYAAAKAAGQANARTSATVFPPAGRGSVR